MSIDQSIHKVTRIRFSKITKQSNFSYREIHIKTNDGPIRLQLFAKENEQLKMIYSGKWAFE